MTRLRGRRFLWVGICCFFLQGCNPLEKIPTCLEQVQTGAEIDQQTQSLVAADQGNWIWQKEGQPITPIRVCWEESSYQEWHADERKAVQTAIENTWEKAFVHPGISVERRLRFTYWEKCQGSFNPEVPELRIRVEDAVPRAHLGILSLAQQSLGNPGMYLNFDFDTELGKKYCAWPRTRKNRLVCIYKIAAHEFGHTLGIEHEQLNEMTPEECTKRAEGDDSRWWIGASLTDYDPASIMNFCNIHWVNAGKLSELDTYGIRRLYYPELASGENVCAYGTDEEYRHFAELARAREKGSYAEQMETEILQELAAAGLVEEP